MARTREALEALVARLSALLSAVRSRPKTAAPPFAKVDGPLDAVNDDFHGTYGEARHDAKYDGPVFVVVADELIVFQRGQRSAHSFSPRAFHVIKSVAHAPVALYALFQRSQPPTRARLDEARERVVAALASTLDDRQGFSEPTRTELEVVLRSCLELIDHTAEAGQAERLAAFAQETGPRLLRLAQEATRLQLDALHQHTEQALQALSVDDRAELQVVVAGDHQARVRSLAMQYFHKRFADRPDADARVSYAEGVSDEHGALELVGTQRLDRTLARAFFGEEQRLQRDILGDAAEQQLHSFEVAQIVWRS